MLRAAFAIKSTLNEKENSQMADDIEAKKQVEYRHGFYRSSPTGFNICKMRKIGAEGFCFGAFLCEFISALLRSEQ
jgi:hypothetical protein